MMVSSRWQKQNTELQKVVWVVSAAISFLLITLMLWLGFRIEMAGVFFILAFVIVRVLLAFIFKNRYANCMVRILKFDYEEIEWDFRMVFKKKHILYYRRLEQDAYRYEFPGHNLIMTVEPYWLSFDSEQSVTKVTLHELTVKNKAFAEMLAASIDEMANQRATN
jgi:hypothetical protein